jgi:hypothetical protein
MKAAKPSSSKVHGEFGLDEFCDAWNMAADTVDGRVS